VIVAGNIGVPLLDVFTPAEPADAYVVEVSSYQASDVTHSPAIGVLLNLYPEHADWHGTNDQYYADKLNLFAHRADMAIVADARDPETVVRLGDDPRVRWYGTGDGFDVDAGRILRHGRPVAAAGDLQLRGDHNLLNACAALTVAELLRVDAALFPAALATFAPLRHRLETVATRGGVMYVNDSIATIPEATMAAVAALSPAPLCVIVGGFDRGQDHAQLAALLCATANVVSVIGVPDTGGRAVEEVGRACAAAGRTLETCVASGIEEAVTLAARRMSPGGVVVLSPGAPSYGHFENFEVRGETFRTVVERLGA
jgi:UDP-N-acetylmuramoylalanine--D-glutamate ligase